LQRVAKYDRSMPGLQIALSGNIGVGKSGLCTLLAQRLGARADLEDITGNPHFESFYADPGNWAFASQLAFAAEGAARHIRAQDGRPVVIDRTVYESVDVFGRTLAARGDLDTTQLSLLESAASYIRGLPWQPKLLIHLTAPIPVLLERIGGRNRPAERQIDGAYLKQLDDAYASFLERWDLCPILTIDATARDLRTDAEVKRLARRVIGLLH
jgi:deoxyadenosine/deoxycytidine kinase